MEFIALFLIIIVVLFLADYYMAFYSSLLEQYGKADKSKITKNILQDPFEKLESRCLLY